MDLTSVREVVDARCALPWQPGDAWLAGGTALFAEPRPQVTRLRDLTAMGWPPWEITDDGLVIAATCTVAELLTFAQASEVPWPRARALITACCRAFSSSFKVWNTATVGGNLCLALPAGPMISMAVALDGVCRVLARDGQERRLPAAEFVTGVGRTKLLPGEMLRSVTLPAAALAKRTAVRRVSLRPRGRSAALVTGAYDPGTGRLDLAVTAATARPLTVRFAQPPSATALRATLRTQLDPALIVDDVHGHPAWRRHMVTYLADGVRHDLMQE
ncbi:FAD binding domain-containing protein [Streptomyces sp. NPDC057806]|uniref:FAD binding domain-containing protein n=1 Tax=Streptomyces sp. NPDC057806 TaxID=3346255 RepID=UPI0036CD818D